MTPGLWLKFSDEASLPYPLTEAERRKLGEIYNAADKHSVWSRAASALGLRAGGGALLRWQGDVPYVNWSLMTAVISCGSMEVISDCRGGYSYATRGTWKRLPALVRSQWRAAQYVEKVLGGALPADNDAQLVESTALGLALQAIMLRLPAHAPKDLALWLATPDAAPAKIQRTIRQMQAIQKRRTQLSPAWFALFPRRESEEPKGPAWFWDSPPLPLGEAEQFPNEIVQGPSSREGEGTLSSQSSCPAEVSSHSHAARESLPLPKEREYSGLPVCAGQVTGKAVIVRSVKKFVPPDIGDFSVLVFPKARPETVEVFSHAAALLFAEGGALSHACTVAREQGIPCITGLGVEFFETLENLTVQGSVFIALDGAAGTVRIVKS